MGAVLNLYRDMYPSLPLGEVEISEEPGANRKAPEAGG